MSLSLPQIAHKGIPVVSTESLAMAYEVKPKQIRQNFSNNKDRFIEGKHFYTLSGNDLQEFRLRVENIDAQISSKTRTLTLWTERGAARHAKMLNSDKAWDMFELLEETFFRVAEQKQDDRISTVEDRRPLNTIVHTWAQASDQKYSMCWKQVNSAFGLESATEFPARWIPDAVAWVQDKIDALPQERPALATPPAKLVEWNGRNFWKELEDCIDKMTFITDALSWRVRGGYLIKHEFFGETINHQVGIAQGALVLARAALGDALRLKGCVNVSK